MCRRPVLHPLFVALRAASLVVPAASLCSTALAQSSPEASGRDPSAFQLPAQEIVSSEAERADGPVDGYVATRSATGTKTDTPILQIPQSVSVITADRMQDQGVQTV